jgi:hypothetical protein
MSEIIALILLSLPLIIELYDDRNGEKHPSKDWFYRSFIAVVAAIAVASVWPKLGFWIDFLRGLVLSFGIFALFFPYLMNIILYRNGVITNHRWWSHLSTKAALDSWRLWGNSPWYVRLFILLLTFFAACLVYYCPCKLLRYENPCF